MSTSEIFSDNEIPQGRRHSAILSNNFTPDFSSSTTSSLRFPPPSLDENEEPRSSFPPIKILIVGGGIAGPLLATFLIQSNLPLHITILEKTPDFLTTGQQIDISGPGVKVLKKYLPELLQKIRNATTKEAGLNFVDKYGRVKGSFPVVKEGEGSSFSNEIEILRGNLVRILVDASKQEARKGGLSKVEYIFEDHVTDLISPSVSASGKVNVTLASGLRKDFDLVVGSDGMRSSVRRLAFRGAESPIKGLGQYTAYFTIPYLEKDGKFASWYNAPLGRHILLRPDNAGYTRAYLSIISTDSNRNILEKYYSLSIVEQKKTWRTLFEDAGWDTKRVLEGMDESKDFYMQEIAQVKLSAWSAFSGQVILLGDAGYCPSPISGMGTTLAVVGSYVLAGELVTSIRKQTSATESAGRSKAQVNFKEAAMNYETKLRPVVEKAQALFPGVPKIINPHTWWGIAILHRFLGIVSWMSGSWVSRLVIWVGGFFPEKPQDDGWDERLDRYEFVRGIGQANGNGGV